MERGREEFRKKRGKEKKKGCDESLGFLSARSRKGDQHINRDAVNCKCWGNVRNVPIRGQNQKRCA